MSLELHKLLREFNIRMDDEGESLRTKPDYRGDMDDSEDDEFDFDFDSEEDGEGEDREFNFGSEDDDDMDGEFGDDDEFSAGLDGEEDDGTFAGERRVDITDKLRDLLAKHGQDMNGDEEGEFGGDDDEFDLSSLDDYSDSPRRMRNHDSVDSPMDDFSDDMDDIGAESERISRKEREHSRGKGEPSSRFDRPRRPRLRR